jgi:hypothetical protein
MVKSDPFPYIPHVHSVYPICPRVVYKDPNPTQITLGASHDFRSISAPRKYLISASFPQHFRAAEIRRKYCISASFPQHFRRISAGAEI